MDEAPSDPPREPDDPALLASARAGDAAALEQLIERYQGRVFRFGLRMCRDPDDARDVVQDTLVAMARGLREFRGDSSLSTWLYTIARSQCLRKRRRSKFAPAEHETVHAADAVVDDGPAPDEAVAQQEIEAAVERAIAGLEPMYREVMILRDVEGLPASEVAQVVGISVDAVKSRLHRARVAVREAVAAGLRVVEPPATADCPDVVEVYSRHLEGEIASDVCAQMERHLAACPRCRGRCDGLRRTLALCRTSASAPVPPEVQAAVRSALRTAIGPGLGREKP